MTRAIAAPSRGLRAIMVSLGATLLLAGAAHAQSAPALPTVLSVTELGTVRQNSLIDGRDGNFSALVGTTSLWAFDDTAMSRANATGQNFIDNTLSWTTDLDASSGIWLNHDLLDPTGTPTTFLGLTPAEQAIDAEHAVNANGTCAVAPCGLSLAVWPAQVVPDPARHRVLFFFNEVSRITGDAAFTVLGAGVAVGTLGPGAAITVTRPPAEEPAGANPALLWNAPEFGYANGAVVVGSTIYAYGQNPQGLVMDVPLAKAPLASATQNAAWQYYAGNNTWSSDASQAVTVFQGGAAGNSVFYNAYVGAFMAIYSEPLTDHVYYRVAATPWGPWSEQALLFTGKAGESGTEDYAALAHTEFATGSGQTQYITYVRTTGFLQMELRLVQVVFGPPAP